MSLLFSQQDISDGVRVIADAIKSRSSMSPDFIVPVMNAGFVFAADLMRTLYPDLNPMLWPIKVIRIPNVSDPKRFTGMVETTHAMGGIKGKRVLLVDTVLGTGVTLQTAYDFVQKRSPRSVNIACLVWLNLPNAVCKPHYFAFNLNGANYSLYGYGLDKDFRYRGCPEIYY